MIQALAMLDAMAQGTLFTTLHFIRNLRMRLVSKSVVTLNCLERLGSDKHSSLMANLQVTKNMKLCEYGEILVNY
jgi:hypothetical protein